MADTGADMGGDTARAAAVVRDVLEGSGLEWEELQPGHYICGRPAKVNQFALTREEVKEREEFLERDDLSLSLGGLEI